MAKYKCKKIGGFAKHNSKRRALSWCRGKKGKAWLLIWLFSLNISAKLDLKNKTSLEEITQVFNTSEENSEDLIFCKGNCYRAKNTIRIYSESLKNGARYLLDILKQTPGIFFIEDTFGQLQIGLFGSKGNERVLFLLDGQRMNDPFDGSSFLYLPIEIIDYIDVYYGPGGAWHGFGSLIGTIAVFTKRRPQIQAFSSYENSQSINCGFLYNKKFNSIDLGFYSSLSANQIWFKNSSSNIGIYDPVNTGMFSNFISIEIGKTSGIYLINNGKVIYENNKDINNNIKINFHEELHLIKKKYQTKQSDIFIKASLFKNKNSDPKNFLSVLEGGVKFHVRPSLAHNLFFGSGGVLSELDNFKKHQGHVYIFGQDEWQIKSPFLAMFGARIALPIDKKNDWSPELLPTIGMVFIPHKKWRYKISFHSSFRTPTFNEMGLAQNQLMLDYERSRTVDAIFWLGDNFGSFTLQNDLGINLTKIDEAIDFNSINKLNNLHEIDIIGLYINSSININNLHKALFGINYSWSYLKEFDENGYAKCKSGIYNIFSGLPSCENSIYIPPLLVYLNTYFNLSNYGELTIFSSLQKFIEKKDNYNIFSQMDISYTSKPMWRYWIWHLGIKNLLGGSLLPKVNSLDLSSEPSKRKGTTFFFGFSINT